MIIVDNGYSKGYILAFPSASSKRKKFLARDISFYMHYVSLRIALHVAMACTCIIFNHNQYILNVTAMATLCYVVARLIFTKHIVVDLSVGQWSYSLAPIPLWLDHLSMYSMLFISVLITSSHGRLGNTLGSAGIIIEISVVLIGLLPFWSYINYARYEHGHKRDE